MKLPPVPLVILDHLGLFSSFGTKVGFTLYNLLVEIDNLENLGQFGTKSCLKLSQMSQMIYLMKEIL